VRVYCKREREIEREYIASEIDGERVNCWRGDMIDVLKIKLAIRGDMIDVLKIKNGWESVHESDFFRREESGR